MIDPDPDRFAECGICGLEMPQDVLPIGRVLITVDGPPGNSHTPLATQDLIILPLTIGVEGAYIEVTIQEDTGI
jgi:hypothetical protein